MLARTFRLRPKHFRFQMQSARMTQQMKSQIPDVTIFKLIDINFILIKFNLISILISFMIAIIYYYYHFLCFDYYTHCCRHVRDLCGSCWL